MKDGKLLSHWYLYIFVAFNILAMFFILLANFWLLWPYRIIDWKTPSFPIVTKQVRQGDYLEFLSDYCKYWDLPSETSRNFVNDIFYSVTVGNTQRTIGCHKQIIKIPVPRELPPGFYHIENIYRYQVNPIRTVTLKHITDTFEVLPEEVR